MLRAIDDDDAFGLKDATEAAGQPFGHPNAHFRNAFGHTILERRRTNPLHYVARGLRDRRGGKELRRRKTAAEGDDVGLLRHFEHLADR